MAQSEEVEREDLRVRVLAHWEEVERTDLSVGELSHRENVSRGNHELTWLRDGSLSQEWTDVTCS
jgi:hypothetical protein